MGRNLSIEARVMVPHSRHHHETSNSSSSSSSGGTNSSKQRNRPQSMFNFPTYASISDHTHSDHTHSSSPRHHARRHTVHDVKAGGGKSKKERRQFQRAFSPQHASEEGAAKTKKKIKSVQRSKDRDDKSSFLQAPSSSSTTTRPPLLADTPRSASISISHPHGADYTDYMPQRSVTESLNPSMYRRGSEMEFLAHGKARVRRTNSDAHLASVAVGGMAGGGGARERRCPPERKQFYRHFIKSIKLFGINAMVASRLETPAQPHLPRHHSANLAQANPFGPTMERLWLEIQAYLRFKTPDQHEQWMFFNSAHVGKVLNRIIHFTCSGVDTCQSVGGMASLSVPNREGYEPLHGSHSSPVLRRESEGGGVNGGQGNGRIPSVEAWQRRHEQAARRELVKAVATPPADAHATTEPLLEEVEEEETNVSEQATEQSTCCKTQHDEFLTLLQRRALGEVDCVLSELDQVESCFMNRKRMGDEHQQYRTVFFKRRVCALVLWQKVTHGLAETLCQLCEWLGTSVLLPEICFYSPPAGAPPPASDEGVVEEEGGVFLASGSTASMGSIRTASPPKSPKSPSMTRFKPQFSVGMPEESEGEEEVGVVNNVSRPPLHPHPLTSVARPPQVTSQVSVARTESSSGQSATTLQRLFSQQSQHEHYREFVSRALKRKGITFTVTVRREGGREGGKGGRGGREGREGGEGGE